MVDRVTQRPTVVFNKGLITESNDLAFPEGASVDESNMTLELDGSRRRRLGVAFEEDYIETSIFHTQGSKVSIHTWENVRDRSVDFIVVQNRNVLHFFAETDDALSRSQKPFTVNLSAYNKPGGLGASAAEVDVTSITGSLIVASPEINTIKVDYDSATDSISVEEIKFRVRDFKFLSPVEQLTSDVSRTTVTPQRIYDTFNSGWRADLYDFPLATYLSNTNNYPKLTVPWYSAKDSSGNFSVGEFAKISGYSSISGNGSFILDLYSGDRSSLGPGFPVAPEIERSRFSTVASFAGRVFYSGLKGEKSDYIYFSQVIYQDESVGDLLQRNDPTAEIFSDLLDTDGGFLRVSGAYGIQRLHVFGPFLLVFATNGVWVVRGVDDVFRATEYSVSKVSEVGLFSEGSFVSADGRPYWWSETGIHTLAGTETGGLQEVNLSIGSIQTKYLSYPASKRRQVKAVYDRLESKIFWFLPSTEETLESKLQEVLVFDERLRAFYPWTISGRVDSEYILAPVFTKGAQRQSILYNVISDNGFEVVTSSGDSVVSQKAFLDYTDTQIKMLTRTESGALTFTAFTDASFLDWGSEDYTSFVESGYDFAGDLSTRKIPVFVTTFLKETESAYSGEEVQGYNSVRPSSCLVSHFWDYRRTSTIRPQQAYRKKFVQIPSDSTYDYPYKVITTRVKLRGYGRSFNLKFESETGKDLHLLGFDVVTGLTGK